MSIRTNVCNLCTSGDYCCPAFFSEALVPNINTTSLAASASVARLGDFESLIGWDERRAKYGFKKGFGDIKTCLAMHKPSACSVQSFRCNENYRIAPNTSHLCCDFGAWARIPAGIEGFEPTGECVEEHCSPPDEVSDKRVTTRAEIGLMLWVGVPFLPVYVLFISAPLCLHSGEARTASLPMPAFV